MAERFKGSRRIVVDEVEYRWRANGNDGFISLAIWPASDVGPTIGVGFGYHETIDWATDAHGMSRGISRGDQLVVTNRLVRRVIELAVSDYGYSASEAGPQLQIRYIEAQVDWSDAVRASRPG
ncbi:hypothetical protein [Alienimonas chondri]|uniref:Uncharacterized protein n=1 Tax=Alienimonas chondri TaxID=2681879 RepID=A0ABX1VFI5_9PLAN|nr:hypothetical protein [Alienimonas chondri]NNJ26847.1 hypothetical protein [Alienimonas chondri]